ncbi:cytochrome P450 [Streptomyces inhibens]|uniref:cytochrome P450 n=1 Tax=Streptomyces inhibens TaxID=2293571 RepID=UPI00402AC3FE
MTGEPPLLRLPFDRPNVLDPAPEYAALRARQPVAEVLTRAGDPAWLALGYEAARALFADERLGRSHPYPEQAPRISTSVMFGGPQGDYSTERESHRRMRKLLMPSFSARRMRRLTDHVQDLLEDLLAKLATRQPPVDLHEELSFPLPVLVICELLGVPYADRDEFRVWSDEYADLSKPAGAAAAQRKLADYMHRLIEAKRRTPAEDVITDLAAAVDGVHFTDDEIADIAVNVLFGGHETTVSRIDYGTVLLLTHPEQAEALRADPALAPAAVEEIMRMSAPSDHGFTRYAHADIGIAGVTIKSGDAVLLLPAVANRDPAAFPDPNRFDITRTPENPHLGFGHGPHFCVGAALARVQLQAMFSTLLQRLPGLQLAVFFEELRLNTDRLTGGLVTLPVTW